MRDKAKTVNFAILYLAGANRISEELEISFMEAKNLIKKWFAAFPEVEKWINTNKATIEATGKVSTYFGRHRTIPEVFSSNYYVKQHNIKSAVNMMLQSPASDINLIGYCRGIKEIREFNLRYKSFALVHDSIVGECHKDDVAQALLHIPPSLPRTYVLECGRLVQCLLP